MRDQLTESLVERIKRYLDAHHDEITALDFARLSFDVHHGQLRRARIERTDDLAPTAFERKSVS